MTDSRYKTLTEYLQTLESVVIAFSGGVDSSFLLRALKDSGIRVKAVIIDSPYMSRSELGEASELAESIGVEYEFIKTEIGDEIRNNPKDRCYLCKKRIFSLILKFAGAHGFKYVVDGTNFDDLDDYRPGLRALRESGIKSPLLEMKFTKADIRELSKSLGLPTWDKPSNPCLLTRIPYDTKITVDDIKMIEEAEEYLHSIGFRNVRVRKHEETARIEIGTEEFDSFLDRKVMKKVSAALKKAGFAYVALDLDGYVTGSLNKSILPEVKDEP